ncbi:fumarylacetoacetate hydrolase family protein [Amycolatopsis sp.]|uniref:fumarylacetoacetate hydrolase family protein n=1 Tax=Amycolatopsis sp. TaxID=37632 RepID=UPI0034598E6E
MRRWHEVELAVVVGRTARHISAADYLDYVFGYTVVNDISARDVMIREHLQIMLCKSADGFLPIAEEIVTADEADGPSASTWVFGLCHVRPTTFHNPNTGCLLRRRCW